MLSRRKTYAGRIKHPDAPTEPATLDPLSAIAHLFRARPEIQDVCRFGLQWEVVHEAEPAGFAQFHIVTNGNCLLERYSGETFKLEAGSILLLPQGDSHVVRSASRGGSSGAPILPHPALGQDFTPSLSRATPSAASEHLSELIGCPISRSFTTYCVCLELRSLPSTGVTRLPRYYE